MVYNNFNEWLDANTQQAHKIISKIKNADDKETLEDTITWLEHELEQNHKIMKFYENAVKEVCDKSQEKKINEIYMTFVHNDVMTNTAFGQSLIKTGKAKLTSSKILTMFKKN